MTDGGDLPWLQDPTGGDVTTAWGAGYRDFISLDPANEALPEAYSLTDNDLADPASRAELKEILRGLAVLKDEDADRLSDYWELETFDGDLSSGPSDERDGDASDGLIEYALGSHANDPASLPLTLQGDLESEGEQFQTVFFRQRLGKADGLVYTVEFSRDGKLWSSAPEDVIEISRMSIFDGTGTELVGFRVVRSIAEQGRGFLRVRVALP